MKLLAIDYGKKNIGMAFSEGFLPSPLTTITVRTKKQVLTDIMGVCERLGIEKIVLGLSGGVLDKEVKNFGEILTKQTSIPVAFVDEALTSRLAVAKMVEGKTSQKKRRTQEHAVAATIILNSYLESQGQ